MNYLDLFKSGHQIKIKKKNRGKFTKSAKAAGEGVQEHAHKVMNDPNATPLQKKRANFAIQAKKWAKKHQLGGVADYSTYPEEEWVGQLNLGENTKALLYPAAHVVGGIRSGIESLLPKNITDAVGLIPFVGDFTTAAEVGASGLEDIRNGDYSGIAKSVVSPFLVPMLVADPTGIPNKYIKKWVRRYYSDKLPLVRTGKKGRPSRQAFETEEAARRAEEEYLRAQSEAAKINRSIEYQQTIGETGAQKALRYRSDGLQERKYASKTPTNKGRNIEVFSGNPSGPYFDNYIWDSYKGFVYNPKQTYSQNFNNLEQTVAKTHKYFKKDLENYLNWYIQKHRIQPRWERMGGTINYKNFFYGNN